MRVAILQPPYPESSTPEAAGACQAWMLERLAGLRPGRVDWVILPEYANCPGLEQRGELNRFAFGQGEAFAEAVRTEARRLACTVAVSRVARSGALLVNRTELLDGSGRCVHHYDKVHLTGAESGDLGLTPGADLLVVEHDGARVGFATCFDLYFAEHFAVIAGRRADLVICPSYQRSETPERILTICQARALDAGAHVLRASYAMPGGQTGGHSLAAAPDGTIAACAGHAPGVLEVKIDPKRKLVKPASYGREPVSHANLIERHRRPALYRPATDRADAIQAARFPHLCAHRGLSAVCPENTIPAFAAAIGLGVHEIELDLWLTADNVPVVCHDPTVDRTTDGTGAIRDLTWEQIASLDAGSWQAPGWKDVTIPTFEQVAKLAAGRVGVNIHLKEAGPDGELVRQVAETLRRVGNPQMAYIAGGTPEIMEAAQALAPDLARACLIDQGEPEKMVAAAIRYGCNRVQFYRTVTDADISLAKAAGLICNLFWSDAPEEAKEYARRGIDVILTNAAHALIAGGFAVM